MRFLETFMWVATLKSSAAAAKRLRVSQSVISMRIAALERALGAELCRGTGRTFELTPAGQRVLCKCETIVTLTGELEDEIRQAVSNPTTIHIGVSEIITVSWLPEFIQGLHDAGHASNIKSGSLPELMGWLQSGEVDVAFVVGPINDPALVNVFICQYEIKWVGAPSLVGNAPKMDLYELSRLPIIQSLRRSYRYEKVLEYFRWHSVAGAPDLQPRNWVGAGFGLMASAHLAAKGVGVAALPATVVETQLAAGQLKVLPIQQEFLPWQIVAAHKRSGPLPQMDGVVTCAHSAVDKFARTIGSSYFKGVGDWQTAS